MTESAVDQGARSVVALLWIGVGFAAFGLLVGTTAGLSTAAITTTLLGLLFALIGGSIGVLLGKLDSDGRKFAGVAMLTFSITAVFGLYSGIYIRVNDRLRVVPSTAADTAIRGNTSPASDYLKSNRASVSNFLELELARNRITLQDACDTLREQGADQKTPQSAQ